MESICDRRLVVGPNSQSVDQQGKQRDVSGLQTEWPQNRSRFVSNSAENAQSDADESFFSGKLALFLVSLASKSR